MGEFQVYPGILLAGWNGLSSRELDKEMNHFQAA